MEIIKTPIEDLIIIKPRVFEDARGFFFEYILPVQGILL